MASLSPEQINTWEKAAPASTGVSRRTAADARSVLCTILGDAVAAKLISYNPALRPRNRGRRTGRKLERSPQRAWATPLQTLLLASRPASHPPRPRYKPPRGRGIRAVPDTALLACWLPVMPGLTPYPTATVTVARGCGYPQPAGRPLPDRDDLPNSSQPGEGDRHRRLV